MSQWLGDLFFRGATPCEIEGMSFSSLSFWGSWADTMRRQDAKKPDDKSGTPFVSFAQAFRKKAGDWIKKWRTHA